MATVRDHPAYVIEEFNGLWSRGDDESAPSDHFIVADNVQYTMSSVETRDGVDKYQNTEAAIILNDVRRIYNYVMQSGQSLLVLTGGGKIYHCVSTNIVHGPILTIPAMEDFGFVAINGRAYITPFKTNVNAVGENYELGLENEFVYVYLGDGFNARKAAGFPPTGSGLTASLGDDGLTDIFTHLFAVVYETDSGYLTALGPEEFAVLELDGLHKIDLINIPGSPDPAVKKRHIVATKGIPEYNGDQAGYQFFFVPEGNIENNTDTVKTVEFFDIDLVADASHLIDNFSEIPAGVCLNTYHSRLVIGGEFGTTETLQDLPAGISDNRSLARVSQPGEPEAISKVDGLIVAPLDGNPITNVQEFRDILYIFKRSRTFSYSDNQDVPASWQEQVIDQGVGAPVHGIGTVLDTGGVNVDFLLIADWSGLMIFNGVYARPEMSWKIETLWLDIVRNDFRFLQVINDSLTKKIWITMPPPIQHVVLHANYANGMDAKAIRWARWLFDVKVSSLTLIETNKLIVGSMEKL